MSSDSTEGKVASPEQPAQLGYEPPRLIPLGNARDLLAGGQGSVVDALDPLTSQSSGG
jgi:hypothetical protein